MTEREVKVHEVKMQRLRSQYPCRGCKYYAWCGEPDRTEKCDGRVTGKRPCNFFTHDCIIMQNNVYTYDRWMQK